MLKLDTPFFQLKGIGPKILNKLKKLEIYTIKDLLFHFPTRYEDFSQIYKIKDLTFNQEATISGKIIQVKNTKTWFKKFYLTEILVSDDTGTIRAIWFNQPFLKNILKPNLKINLSGKISLYQGQELYFNNPQYEILKEKKEPTHTARIVPIYPETKGLTSKFIRLLINQVLKNVEKIKEFIPAEILKKENLPEINQALKQIHFPKSLKEALQAKKRFAFEDLFLLQLHLANEKLKLSEQTAISINFDLERIKNILKKLPFELTLSQKKALWEILKDLNKTKPMNRLLQGDVGSGKTIIALISALEVAFFDYQTAFMAPTEILARQHYETFKKFFKEFEITTALITSKDAKIFYGLNLETKIKKQKLIEEIKNDKIKIIFGTHSLIQEKIKFKKLAYLIIDEQHRFGVEQRAHLLKKSNQAEKNFIPHFLSMSATPIPRTLSLALFGDLDLSLINELPKNRKPIITKIIPPTEKEKTYQFIYQEIKKGRQAFVICPRIETTEQNEQIKRKLEIKSVKEEYQKLKEKIFPDLKIAMLHGKLKSQEKEEIMKKFQNNEINILVSTSVIEVGIDVPNATIMMIEGAERFGLAQLYQFKGRVGRGEHQSYCFLFTEVKSKEIFNRLKAIVEAKNGFELAEKDLKMRGPGEFLGEIQTGMPDLAMKALQNPELVKKAKEYAFEILKKDPKLNNAPALKEKLKEFKINVHLE